jgi:DNA-binding transcriptional LysR family regulator
MNLRRIDLNLLTIFDAVIREQNYTRAAENVCMSQPAVSDAVVRLRHLLKDELFVRTGRGVRPTPRALQYAPQVRRILDLVVLLVADSESFSVSTSKRRFNVALGEYGEFVILPILVKYLEARGSDIGFSAFSQRGVDLVEALCTGELDLVLGPEPIIDRDVQSEIVFTEQMVSMMRRGHPLVKKRLTLKKFLELRHVVYEWPGRPQAVVDQWLQRNGLKRDCHLQVHSLFDMPRVVAQSDMSCSLPSKMAHPMAEAYDLTCFPIPIPDMEVPAYMSWHESFNVDPGLAWLRNAIPLVLEGEDLDDD